MFQGQNLFAIIQKGGGVMYVLLLCSVVSVAVIIERVKYYRSRSRVKREEFMEKIKGELKKKQIKNALEACRQTDTPFAQVVRVGLNLEKHSEKVISQAMEREIVVETTHLERFISIVGTIGSTAVYIGLLGTVLGIIQAFHDIFEKGAGGISVVINGVSEALICTAAGLLVSIPAVISYNFFIRKIDNFVVDMELCASELIDLICLQEK